MGIGRTEQCASLWIANALEPAIARLVGQYLCVPSKGDSVPVAVGRDVVQGHNRLWSCHVCCSVFLTMSVNHTMQVLAFN